MALLPGCLDPEAGCTPENCRRMVSGCRVELVGGPSDACFKAAAPPEGFDSTPYCVQTCRQQGAGRLVECIAQRADLCEAAGQSFADRESIIGECVGTASGTSGTTGFDATCDTQCESARKECDQTCLGGAHCADCLRTGASCAGCVDGGFVACTDCSAECGRAYIDCSRGCAN
jgi:hypothetical protein